MRYRYFYQSKENKSCEGWIDAHDRNDAYNQLRKQGIKPYKLLGRNPLAWKRWAAIGVLGVATAVLAVVLMRKLADDRREAFAWEDRAQLYGDPSLLRELAADGWRRAMGGDEGDAWFARHARPGLGCGCSEEVDSVAISAKLLRLSPEDSPEIDKMKRMVNGMKREFAAYVEAGGAVEDYKALCDERIRTEQEIESGLGREFKALEARLPNDGYEAVAAEWAKKNALLRSMGLPTRLMPDPGTE